MVTKRIVNRMGHLPPCIHEGDASTGESRIGGILGIQGRAAMDWGTSGGRYEHARRLVSNDKVAGITTK